MDLNTMDNNVKSVFLNYKDVLLHSAVKSGDHALIHFLLDQCKANPNRMQSTTPLFEASENGHIEVVKILIKYGANVNNESKTEVINHYNLLENEQDEMSPCYMTPLHIAIINEQLEVAKILIENGANVNADLGYDIGYTPLFSAVNEKLFEFAKLLIQNGAEIHSEHREVTLLQIACQVRHLDMVKLLIDNGANSHQLSEYGSTILYTAAYDGNFEIVKFLIDSGANICEKTKYGLPIHGVIKGWRRHRDESFMKTLQILTTPETVNSISTPYRTRETPLRLAAENGLLQVVKYLLKNGAIPDQCDLQAARNEQVIELLKNEIEKRKLKDTYILGV